MISLAALVERHQKDFLYSGRLDKDQFSAFNSLRICRTPKAQGALYCCDGCGELRFVYHSCGHRFCPNCQNYKCTQWLFRQKQRLLPCDYFMITFTIPAELRELGKRNKEAFYKALFKSSAASLQQLCRTKLKGECGAIAVLHSNSRTLTFHPHIHFIVPGIILNKNESSIKRVRGKYFLHYKPLSELFRGKLLAQLKDLGLSFPSHLYAKKWNVNCQNKGNGQGSLEYLSRYLMKGVVSEKSLTQNGRQIHLRYQDSTTKKMETINFSELDFLNRLAEHVKPKGFHTIREYGFLAPSAKKKLIRVQLLLHKILPLEPLPEKPKVTCPCCGAEMTLILRKVDSQWWEKNIAGKERAPPEAEYA